MYFIITFIRNLLFDWGVIKAKQYNDVFVICVGNIRVGGTGKTPMIEYLIRHFSQKYSVCVVSLGYKRKTKGLKEVLLSDTAETVGDEPKQMKENFPQIPFFVCKNRNTAIDYIRKTLPNTQIILLDDAYQYRKTTPNYTILLTEYSRPYFKDCIIPYGRLRERRKESRRANCIVITKCPASLTKDDKRQFIKQLNPLPYQKIFFSVIKYKWTQKENENKKLLFVCGIDNPLPAIEFLQSMGYDVILKKYPDHYSFTNKDIEQICSLATNERRIITTQKDAVRLKNKGIAFEVLAIENELTLFKH